MHAPPTRRDWRAVVQHLWLDEHDARRLLGPAGQERLTQRVRDSEAGHPGEIRICIEAALPLRRLLRGCTPRQRALELFDRLGVGRTRGRNGVLVYLLLADHAIELVVDPVLQAAVAPAQWQDLLTPMQPLLRAGGNAEQCLLAMLERLDGVLRQHLPNNAAGTDNPNELPDDPLLL